MKKLLFVATTPFAVNAFLFGHLVALSREFEVVLCANLEAYKLNPTLHDHVRVVHIDVERKISLWADIRALLQLLRLMLAERPMAVHSITPKAGLLAMLAGFIARIRYRHHTFTGQVWVTRSGISRALLKSIDRLIASCSTRVFADSESQSRLIQHERIVAKGEISVLGYGSISGVELTRFCPDQHTRMRVRSKMEVHADCCVFLFVGRMTRDKGVFDLMRGFSRVAETHPNTQLWFVGPDEEQLERRLIDMFPSVRERVRWIGATYTPEHWMAAGDVLVLPSYREGFGSVIIEAAACEVPAVAYRIDGVVDAVEENRTGLLVPCGDTDSLALAMAQLAESSAVRRELGLAARERAVQRFSSTSVTLAWLGFYRAELEA